MNCARSEGLVFVQVRSDLSRKPHVNSFGPCQSAVEADRPVATRCSRPVHGCASVLQGGTTVAVKESESVAPVLSVTV